MFRDTNEAKEAILEFTNAQIASDAHLYFQKAYEEALSNGDIKEGDSVEIDLHVTSNSEINQKTSAFIQDSINEACKTTQLAGKIKINLKLKN